MSTEIHFYSWSENTSTDPRWKHSSFRHNCIIRCDGVVYNWVTECQTGDNGYLVEFVCDETGQIVRLANGNPLRRAVLGHVTVELRDGGTP